MNPSSKVRDSIYLISVFVNATVAVLLTEITLSIWVIALVAGFNAAVAILAKNNITPDEL